MVDRRHPVAGFHMADIGAHRRDRAGRVAARHEGGLGLHLVAALHHQRVGVVESDGMDVDQHLVRPRRRVRHLFQPVRIERPELAYHHTAHDSLPRMIRPGTYHPALSGGTLAPGLTPAGRLTTIAPNFARRGIRHDAARGRDGAGRGARPGDPLHLGEGAARRLQGARPGPGRAGRFSTRRARSPGASCIPRRTASPTSSTGGGSGGATMSRSCRTSAWRS